MSIVKGNSSFRNSLKDIEVAKLKKTKIAGIPIKESKEDLQDYIYEAKPKTIVGTGDLINGQTYEFADNYDMNDFDFSIITSGIDIVLYNNTKTGDIIKLIDDDGGVIGIVKDSKVYYYTNHNSDSRRWCIDNNGSMSPYDVPKNITIEFDSQYVYKDCEDILKLILATPENIRTVKEKIADVKNWDYDTETAEVEVYGFKEGVNYKFNFNASEYLDRFSQFTPYPNQTYIYGYNGNKTLDSNCSIYSTSVSVSTFRIVINGNEYYFIIDVNNEKLGTWRKGSSPDSEAYTDEELEDITFVLDSTKVSQDYAEFTKEVLLDSDGNPVEELVDGTTYKINFDVRDYLDIFDWYSDNGRTVSGTYDWYIYGDNTVGVNSICYYASGSLGSLYISLPNYTYYYLCPAIGTYYPGRWYKSSEIRPSNLRTPEELRDVEFTMVRKAIVNEELLRAITTNTDGTPIAEDHTETVVTKALTMDGKLKDFPNWIYKKDRIVKTTVPTGEDLINDTEYTVLPTYDLSLFDKYFDAMISQVNSNRTIYNDSDNNITISLFIRNESTPGIEIKIAGDHYYYISSMGENWLVGDGQSEPNITDTLPSIIYNENNITRLASVGPEPDLFPDSEYSNVLALIFIEPTVEVTEKEISLQEHLEDFKNWTYNKIGLKDKIDWEALSKYEGYKSPEPGYKFGAAYYNSSSNVQLMVNIQTDNDMGEIIRVNYLDNDRDCMIYNVSNDEVGIEANVWYDNNNNKIDKPEIILDLESEDIEGKDDELINILYSTKTETLTEKIDSLIIGNLKDATYEKKSVLLFDIDFEKISNLCYQGGLSGSYTNYLIYNDISNGILCAYSVSGGKGSSSMTFKWSFKNDIYECRISSSFGPGPRNTTIKWTLNDENPLTSQDQLPELLFNKSAVNPNIDPKIIKALINDNISITLGEKLTEGIKDWIYKKGNNGITMQVMYDISNIAPTIYETIYEDGGYSYQQNPTKVYLYEDTDNGISIAVKAEQSSEEKSVYVYVYYGSIEYTCLMRYSDSNHYTWSSSLEWSSYDNATDTSNNNLTESDLPENLPYNEKCIISDNISNAEEIVKGIIDIQIINEDITLEEKIKDLPNWEYKEDREAKTIEANVTYTLPSKYDLSDIPTGTAYEYGGGSTVIRRDAGASMVLNTGTAQTMDNGAMPALPANGNIEPATYDGPVHAGRIMLMENNGVKGIAINNAFYNTGDGWKIMFDSTNATIDNFQLIIDNLEYIADNEILSKIIFGTGKVITLKEKLNEPLKDKIYEIKKQTETITSPIYDNLSLFTDTSNTSLGAMLHNLDLIPSSDSTTNAHLYDYVDTNSNTHYGIEYKAIGSTNATIFTYNIADLSKQLLNSYINIIKPQEETGNPISYWIKQEGIDISHPTMSTGYVDDTILPTGVPVESQEELPNFIIEESVFDVPTDQQAINYSVYEPIVKKLVSNFTREIIIGQQTLGEKIADLKNWAYETKEAEGETETVYNIKNEVDWDGLSDLLPSDEWINAYNNEETHDYLKFYKEKVDDKIQIQIQFSYNGKQYFYYNFPYELHTNSGVTGYNANVWYTWWVPSGSSGGAMNIDDRSYAPVSPSELPKNIKLDSDYINSNYGNALSMIFDITEPTGSTIEITTLEDKLADIKNWAYDVKSGAIDWSMFDDLTFSNQFIELYFDNSNQKSPTIIEVGKMGTMYNLIVVINRINYMCISKDMSDNGLSASANTWYTQTQNGITEATKPELEIDPACIVPGMEDYVNALFSSDNVSITTVDDVIKNANNKKVNTMALSFRTNINWNQFVGFETNTTRGTILYSDNTSGMSDADNYRISLFANDSSADDGLGDYAIVIFDELNKVKHIISNRNLSLSDSSLDSFMLSGYTRAIDAENASVVANQWTKMYDNGTGIVYEADIPTDIIYMPEYVNNDLLYNICDLVSMESTVGETIYNIESDIHTLFKANRAIKGDLSDLVDDTTQAITEMTNSLNGYAKKTLKVGGLELYNDTTNLDQYKITGTKGFKKNIDWTAFANVTTDTLIYGDNNAVPTTGPVYKLWSGYMGTNNAIAFTRVIPNGDTGAIDMAYVCYGGTGTISIDGKTLTRNVWYKKTFGENNTYTVSAEMPPEIPDAFFDATLIANQTLFDAIYSNTNGASPVNLIQRFTDIDTKIPACPTTTDGTFVLKCVVASGVPTYQWVAENPTT